MNQPIHDDELNRILLKPRFKMKFNESEEAILEQFRLNIEKDQSDYISKIIDHHIVIDVPIKEQHFWSPQLHVEVEKDVDNKTIVRGLFGPKPQVWTFFMFIHFAVAVAFIVFFVVAYTQWSLQQEYSFALMMCIAMPILWVVLYILGQLGKKKGYQQMLELNEFLKKVLEK